MRLLVLFSLALAGAGASLPGAEAGGSALAAVKLLPRDKAAKLARIEARDGTPDPDRWYLLVHDPAEENGVHEYVVVGKEIVASRAISQFADALKPEDVIGAATLKIDSDRAAKIARQYAQANNAAIAKMNYELKREGADSAPVWKVLCLDEAGTQVGEVTVTAGKGNVVSHEGFAIEPQPSPSPTPVAKSSAARKKPAPKSDVYSGPQPAPDAPATAAAPQPAELQQPSGDDLAERHGRRRPREERGSAVGEAARGVGRTIRRFLPF